MPASAASVELHVSDMMAQQRIRISLAQSRSCCSLCKADSVGELAVIHHMTAYSIDASRTIVEETKLFKITVSFGSVSSLISLPCYMSHASIPAALRASRGLPDDLIRISTGIEDAKDLLAGTLFMHPAMPDSRGRCWCIHSQLSS